MRTGCVEGSYGNIRILGKKVEDGAKSGNSCKTSSRSITGKGQKTVTVLVNTYSKVTINRGMIRRKLSPSLKLSRSFYVLASSRHHPTCSIARLLTVQPLSKPIKPFLWQLKVSERNLSIPARQDDPTIYALSTAPGRAAIAIIRISGPACLTVYQALCPDKPPPKPRFAALRTLYSPETESADAEIIDSSALTLHFPAPETATGEDVLELHVHGGTAVVKAVLAAIPKAIPNGGPQLIRYAEPGEFTRRAFYNNRLDLLQIEALGETLAADTEQQRRLAVRGSTSVLAERYESWRQKLLYARGELEALIDFSEDQHFDESPAKLCTSVAKQVRGLKVQLKANIDGAARGELLRHGINIALIGAPNAGKSSLLNQIVGREAAIVSSEPGTTRDVVDVNVDIGGYFCRFGDLAGLRKQSDALGIQQIGEIEQEGMRRAKQRALTADVVIVVLSAKREEMPSGPHVTVDVEFEVQETLKQCNLETQKVVFVLNKADLFDSTSLLSHISANLRSQPSVRGVLESGGSPLFAVSCTSAQQLNPDKTDSGGIKAFLDGLTDLFGSMTSAALPRKIGNNSTWAESLGATERQRFLLQDCLQHLESFLTKVRPALTAENEGSQREDDIDVVLAAESLRSAADCLAKIAGKGETGDVEEVLGVVFEKYVCQHIPQCPY